MQWLNLNPEHVVDTGVLARSIVVGLRPIMTPLVEGAIRADQKDKQRLLARSA
jgi:hypothetical protein